MTHYTAHFKVSAPSSLSMTLFRGLLMRFSFSRMLPTFCHRAIEKGPPLHCGKGFHSSYFLIPKRKGRWYPFLGLRKLRSFIRELKFRMVTLGPITHLCRQRAGLNLLTFRTLAFQPEMPVICGRSELLPNKVLSSSVEKQNMVSVQNWSPFGFSVG